ncbi:hypothetical protein FQZ97_1126790 [compost metagenome]
MTDKGLEIIPGHGLAVEFSLHVVRQVFVLQRSRRRRESAVAEVLAVDPDDVELVCQHLDLTLEVDGSEPPVPEGTGEGVRRGGELDPGVGEFPHEP